jgi:hypothetical protein
MQRTVLLLAVFLVCWNVRSNALQVIIALYLHAKRTPDHIIRFLSKAGLSVSTSSIDNAITSLTKQARDRVRSVGQQRKHCLAFDNLDVMIRTLVPTQDGKKEKLANLCTATMIPLHLPKGVTWDDLRCSGSIWTATVIKRLYATKKSEAMSRYLELDNAVNLLYPEPTKIRPNRRADLTRTEDFMVYLYMVAIISHGPEELRKFESRLQEVEPIAVAPLAQRTTKQVPLSAIDQEVGSVPGTIAGLSKLLLQMGIWPGESSDLERDPLLVRLDGLVMFLHCDLGALEKVLSAQRVRSIEATPEHKLESLVPVLGLFHLKMACADAIWRILIHKKPGQGINDPNSLFSMLAKLRPDQTGHFTSKKGPGFRRMHEVIQHVGIVSRLDRWRLVISEKTSFSSLDTFAKSEPTFEALIGFAEELATRAGRVSMEDPAEETTRDICQENQNLQQRLFVMYEELTYGMNTGDIGRVECLFVPWILVFKGCGKHKYAKHMTATLWNLHFVYSTAVA